MALDVAPFRYFGSEVVSSESFEAAIRDALDSGGGMAVAIFQEFPHAGCDSVPLPSVVVAIRVRNGVGYLVEEPSGDMFVRRPCPEFLAIGRCFSVAAVVNRNLWRQPSAFEWPGPGPDGKSCKESIVRQWCHAYTHCTDAAGLLRAHQQVHSATAANGTAW